MYTILLRRRAQFFLLSGLLTLTACSTASTEVYPVLTEPQPTPVPEIVAPAPPPPLHIPVRPLETRTQESLIRAAGNHAVLMGYVHKIADETISSPEHMNQTMDNLSQVFSPGIGPALIGYGALIGAQNSQFAEGVIETARYRGLDTVIYQLYVDPGYAETFPGAELASADIQNAWMRDITALDHSAAHIKEQSYGLQKLSKWEQLRADSRAERLEAIGRAQSLRFNPPGSTKRQIAKTGTIRAADMNGPQKRQDFWQVFGQTTAPENQDLPKQSKTVMHHKALTLSALEILGATGKDSSEWIDNYMTSPSLTQCVNTARLNTEQCIAAGHFKYEDAFCIAEHELKEISTCLSDTAR